MDRFIKIISAGVISATLVACGGSSSSSGNAPEVQPLIPALPKVTPYLLVKGLETTMGPLKVQLGDDTASMLDITTSGEHIFDAAYEQAQGTALTLRILASSEEQCVFKEAKASNKKQLEFVLKDEPVVIHCAAADEENTSTESSNENYSLFASDLVNADDDSELLGLVKMPLTPSHTATTTITLTDAEGEPLAYRSVFVASEKDMLALEGCDIYSGQAISHDGEIALDEAGQACIQVKTKNGFGVDRIVVTFEDLELKQQIALWHDQAEVYLTLLDVNGNPDYGHKWAANNDPENYVYGIPLTNEADWKTPTDFAVVHLKLNNAYGPLANIKVEYEIDEEIAGILGVVPPVFDEDGNELIGRRSTDLTDKNGVSNWVRIVCVRDGAANLIATVPGLTPVAYPFQCGDKRHSVVINE